MANNCKNMKSIFQNILIGMFVTLSTWLIMIDNYFVFGLLTPIVFALFMMLYYYLTTKFNWIITILSFLFSLFLTGHLIDIIDLKFPDYNFTDEEHFPLSNYFVLWSFLWIISKVIFDILLMLTLKKKYIKLSVIENRKRESKII